MKIKLPHRKLEATVELLKCLTAKHVDDVCRICDVNYNNSRKGLKLRIISNGKFITTKNRLIKELYDHRILIKYAKTPKGRIAEYYTNEKYLSKLESASQAFLSELQVKSNKPVFISVLDRLNVLNDDNDDCYVLLDALHSFKYTPMSDLNKLIKPQSKLSKAKSRLKRAGIIEEDDCFNGLSTQRKAIRLNITVVDRYIDYIKTMAQIIQDEKKIPVSVQV